MGPTPLGSRARGFTGVVVGVGVAANHDGLEGAELERRLLEIGFVEGARVEILHEGAIGRDPIAVRLDDMRVALRRREANAVMVQADTGEAVYLAAAE
ncbi:MAG: FeoA family protein [Caulobacteraceae bacterium]